MRLVMYVLLFCAFGTSQVAGSMDPSVSKRQAEGHETNSLTIVTVDKDGVVVAGQQLEWWPQERPERKTVIKCAGQACGTWALIGDGLAEKTIAMAMFAPMKDDAQCWDRYDGTIDPYDKKEVKDLEVQVTFVNSVCA